jgi:hypothetical protein
VTVAADGGLQPSDPVTDEALIKFLRYALRKAEVFSYTVHGVKDQPWLTHVWTFEIDLEPGQLVRCDQTGNVYRVIQKNVKNESSQKGLPESVVTVEFVGNAVGVRDVASTTE